jgi:dTDP-4-amino-4,6-dideoxygalactose transaminase
MTTGEGGMLITDDEELYDRARCMRSYGEELVDKVGERRYEHVTLGFNYRLGALNASIGINQLDRLEDMVALRNRNAAFLHERLADLVAITPPRVVDYCRHAYYKYVCRINRNEIKTDLMTFVEAVRAEGIPVTPRYPRPLPLQKVFREKGGYGTTDCPYGCDKYGREPSFLKGSWPEAERVGEEAFVVQVHPTIGEEDYDDVIRAFQKVAAHFEKS